MWLNNRHPVLADVRVRRAIMYALDREAMRNVAWYGFGKVATGPFNSSVRYYTDQVTRYPRDVARAKQLLKEAGYKGQTLRLLPLPYGETWQRYAEIARQNLAEVGIKLEMTATDVAGWSEKTANWDYDIAFCYLYQYGDAALGVSRNYLTSTIARARPGTTSRVTATPRSTSCSNAARRKPIRRSAARCTKRCSASWSTRRRWPGCWNCNSPRSTATTSRT